MPKQRDKGILKRLLVLPPLLVGAAVLAFAVSDRQAPQQAEPGETARPVRVVTVEPTDFVPRALGYGFVRPGSVWEAVAEVAGKIAYRHPDLERGRLMQAGTVILRIDPTDYQLAIARIDSNLESTEAELAQLAVRQANIGNSLKIERRSLALAREDLDRRQRLLQRGNTSQVSVDEAETAVLNAEQRVQDLENELNLIPADRRVLEANRALERVQRQEARRDLERTEISLPFDARIAEVNVEKAQFASAGQTLVVADSIDVAEVTAQIPIDRIRPLIRPGGELSSLSAEELSQLQRRFGLTAEVRLVSGGLRASWEARFDRASDSMDQQTRTVGMVVAVDEPYRKTQPGRRPPLTKNMYVEVELRAPPRSARIVVPRVAVHQGPDGGRAVYLANAESRLTIQPVTLGPAQGDFVVVQDGLEPGDRVLVSDLIPAIDGMLLEPSDVPALAERLRAEAAGTEALR